MGQLGKPIPNAIYHLQQEGKKLIAGLFWKFPNCKRVYR